MCKHVHIAQFGIRSAQVVICMRLHTDRIHKSKIHFYCVSPSQTDVIRCFQGCNLTSAEEIEAVSVCYS